MKAYKWTAYGAPEVLQLEERETPQPGANELLIRNHATSVFAGDCELRRFSVLPAIRIPLRLFLGLRKPKRVRTLGQEFSGTVEAVGANVQDFQPGQAVFGPTAAFGAYAEYHCLNADLAITCKPEAVSHSAAAVLPVGGMWLTIRRNHFRSMSAATMSCLILPCIAATQMACGLLNPAAS